MHWDAGVCFYPSKGWNGKNVDVVRRCISRVQAVVAAIDIDIEGRRVVGRSDNRAELSQLRWDIPSGVLLVPARNKPRTVGSGFLPTTSAPRHHTLQRSA